jgi:hypothetical protein
MPVSSIMGGARYQIARCRLPAAFSARKQPNHRFGLSFGKPAAVY